MIDDSLKSHSRVLHKHYMCDGIDVTESFTSCHQAYDEILVGVGDYYLYVC